MSGSGTLCWKSEELMKKELSEIIRAARKNDGLILAAEGKFSYKKVAYIVKVFRYFNKREGFTPIGSQRISDSHAVVEYPEETRPIVERIPSEFNSEFLFHDTLHMFNDKQSITEQIALCHNWAKRDIDDLLEGNISKKIDERIKELQYIKKMLNNINMMEK